MTTGIVTVRSLETLAELEACVELQRETWGRDFTGCVPATMLMVARKVGGVTAGAFDGDDRLLGFVFGITGYVRGRPVHWSHMLAVRESARNAGIGIRLKLHQRELLLDNGVDTARWTYDPLVAKNAHVNLNRLGAVVVEYVEDMYGASNSALHAGLGTDRFVVEWRLTDERVKRVVTGLEQADSARFDMDPIVNDAPEPPPPPPGRARARRDSPRHLCGAGTVPARGARVARPHPPRVSSVPEPRLPGGGVLP